jgi:hypothetical protein
MHPETLSDSQLKTLIVDLALEGYLSSSFAWFILEYFHLVSA